MTKEEIQSEAKNISGELDKIRDRVNLLNKEIQKENSVSSIMEKQLLITVEGKLDSAIMWLDNFIRNTGKY